MTTSDQPVVIVGAGPTGLIVAIELARRGIGFHLVDRMVEPTSWSAAIFIKPRSLEILAALGLTDAFMEHGQIVEEIDLYLGDRQVGAYQFRDLDTPYPYILSIPEEQTIRLLTDKLEQLSGRVRRGVEFVGLEQSAANVRVRLRSEEAGDEVLDARWVVGADGYRSAVREATGDPFQGRDYPELWGVVDGRIENWCHPRSLTCVQLEPPIVIPFPLGKDRWRVYFRPETTDEAALGMVEKRLGVICPGARLVDRDAPAFFKSHSRLARTFRVGRVLLAGDAAHGSNPIEGHGMNAGMQDAFNLGWKLALLASGYGSEPLLESYETERRPVDRSIVQSGDEAYVRMDPRGGEARREAIDFLSTSEGRRYAALAESEINFAYDESPLVDEVGSLPPSSPGCTPKGARVGEVAGLIGSRGASSLYDLIYGTSVSLFILPEDRTPAAVAEARGWLRRAVAQMEQVPESAFIVLRGSAPERPVPEDLIYDPMGKLHERLVGRGPGLCLIRPDGHLGFRSAPPDFDALSAYLARLYGSP